MQLQSQLGIQTIGVPGVPSNNEQAPIRRIIIVISLFPVAILSYSLCMAADGHGAFVSTDSLLQHCAVDTVGGALMGSVMVNHLTMENCYYFYIILIKV